MRFVRHHPSVPVPKVYCVFVHRGQSYIFMQRIPGKMAGSAWALRSEESKRKILDQLKGMVQQLRNIEPPPGIGVSNSVGGAIYDGRLPNKSFWGPFTTADEFHRELRDSMDLEAHYEDVPDDLQEPFAFHGQQFPRSVLTHGDLSSLNILVRDDEVVDIIDWETAGWFPPYWEYACAWNVNSYNEFWQQEVDKFLSPMPYESRMESIRRNYFGDF
ncbi:hypothetical protein DL770_006075 [Monosporascus sp. CRB-9-2]|nr:hypothetical protein DL770_006075 [Monosporascus sp. CRB-9-2]